MEEDILYQITLYDSDGTILQTKNKRLVKRRTHRETLSDDGAEKLMTTFPTLSNDGCRTRVCIKEITDSFSPIEYELDDEIKKECYAMELHECEPGSNLDPRNEHLFWRSKGFGVLLASKSSGSVESPSKMPFESQREASLLPNIISEDFSKTDTVNKLANELKAQRFVLYVPGSRQIPEAVADILCSSGASEQYAQIGKFLGITADEMAQEPEEKTDSMKLRQRIIMWVERNPEKATLEELLRAAKNADVFEMILPRLVALIA